MNGYFVFDNGSGLLVQPAFSSFSVMSSEQGGKIIKVLLFLLIQPQVDAFGRQHWYVSAGTGVGDLLGRPSGLDQKGNAPDDVRVGGFKFIGFIGAMGSKMLSSLRFVAMCLLGALYAIAL